MKPILALFLTLAALAIPLAWGETEVLQGTSKGDLESNLSIFNLFETRPEPVQRFYAAAYGILAADPRAAFLEMTEDPEIQRLCGELCLTHLGGPMLGAVTADGVRVWLRTLKPAAVEVRVTTGDGERVFGPVHSTPDSDLTAVVTVTGLKPATRYPYRVLVDGQPITMPDHAAIVTAPDPAETGTMRIAFGSCFHRWGIGNAAQAQLIRSRNPVAMLLLGDIAAQDRNNHLGLHRADYLMRDLQPPWQGLAAAIPLFAIWDDHDYFDNDLAGIPEGFAEEDRQGVRQVFQQAWNNPAYGFGDTRGGLFLRTRLGPCDIIMLDTRYFRENVDGSFLGEEQMQWVEAQLLDCQGPFIILSSGTMWSDYVSNGKDSWGRWDPEGRERLFSFIEANRIGGVLLIAGDRHGARGFRIPRPSGFSFYEFEPASLGGRKGPPVTDPEWTTQLFGFALTYAFGEFTFDTTLDDPEVTFRLIRDDATELYTLTLKHSELTPPAR